MSMRIDHLCNGILLNDHDESIGGTNCQWKSPIFLRNMVSRLQLIQSKQYNEHPYKLNFIIYNYTYQLQYHQLSSIIINYHQLSMLADQRGLLFQAFWQIFTLTRHLPTQHSREFSWSRSCERSEDSEPDRVQRHRPRSPLNNRAGQHLMASKRNFKLEPT